MTCFQESAEAILGQNTVYLGELKEKVGCVFVSLVMCLPGATELLHACFGCGVCALTALSENLPVSVLCVSCEVMALGTIERIARKHQPPSMSLMHQSWCAFFRSLWSYKVFEVARGGCAQPNKHLFRKWSQTLE